MPWWIKIFYAMFLCVLVPVYAVQYRLGNFLWFSDIALVMTGVALWLESSLLASMMAVAVLLPEAVWNLGFFARLIFGVNVMGIGAYMFDPHRPMFLRAFSLFHVFLPVVLVWMMVRLRYDRRALMLQTILVWIVLPVTYLVTEPVDDVNWVFGLGSRRQEMFGPVVYVGILMVAFPVMIYWPTHWVLGKLFWRR